MLRKYTINIYYKKQIEEVFQYAKCFMWSLPVVQCLFYFLLFFCWIFVSFMKEKTAFGSNELYSYHALHLKRIYISAFILLLAAISYLIITVDKRQSPIPLVTEPGLSYSVSGFNSGYMKAGNRPLLHFVESWQENQSFQACRFLSLHCRHPTL